MNKLQIAIQDIKYMPKTVGFVLKVPFILLIATLLTLVSMVVGVFANIPIDETPEDSIDSIAIKDSDHMYSIHNQNIFYIHDD
jgi:hypothetical protein